MKVLILVPNLNNVGGVSALYNILKIARYDNIDYFEIQGNRKWPFIVRIFEILYSYVIFIFILLKYDIVHANPSLDRKSFLRDGLYVLIGKLFRKKVLVYWHGWEDPFEQNIRSKKLLRVYFKHTFLKAKLHIVLGNIFKQSLIQFGVPKEKIIIESNAADNSYLTLKKQIEKKDIKNKSIYELLFIARIVETKGIFIAIDTLKRLNNHGSFHLTVAGDGPTLAAAKRKIEDESVGNVTFLGVIKGAEKHQLFSRSDMLLFPTYYPEGMPICIIEAMMYGLPVISRPVGGIPDLVKNGENGYLIESKEAEDFADCIKDLCRNKKIFEEISIKNIAIANEYFTPEAVNKRLFGYYHQLMKQ